MPVTIDEVEVQSAPEAAPPSTPHREPAKPDPRELERALRLSRERLARVRAH
jgi:hypothetical protein